jgi:hypothetical protein
LFQAGGVQEMKKASTTRRTVLGGLGGFAGASLLKSQQDPFRDHSRVPGMDELKTAVEFDR